jgi:hypothetical protein
MRIDLFGDVHPTINLFQPYVDGGIAFTSDHTMDGQLHGWGNSTPHVLDHVLTFPSMGDVLSDDPRPHSHVVHIGLVHGPFDSGRIQCDLSVADASGIGGSVVASTVSSVLAMSVYRGNGWSVVGDAAYNNNSRRLAARTRQWEATTDELCVLDASGAVADTGVTLHVFTTVPYARTAHVDWARVTVRLRVWHTPVCSPLVLPLDLGPSRPTFPTCVPAWCTWTDDATARVYTSGRVGCVVCACVDGERPPVDPLRRRDDRIAVLNTWVPGQHVVQFLMLEVKASSGQVLTRCTAERVVSVVTSSRMEMHASPLDGSGGRSVVLAVPSGSPIVFLSTVRKFTSQYSVWCAPEATNHGAGRTFADYSAERQRRWYDQVIRPILVDGLFRVCTEVSSTSRLLEYDATENDDGPSSTTVQPLLYTQPYIGAYKQVTSARILNAFVDCETPRPASSSTSVLTAYMRRFMQRLLFRDGWGEDARLLASVSCASSLSPYALSLLEQYASSTVNDRVIIVLPALTVSSGSGGGGDTETAATRIYPRVHSSANTTTTDQRGAFLVVVRVGAIDDIDSDASGGAVVRVVDALRSRLATVGPLPSLAWTTPEWIEEGLTYTSLVARVVVSRPSLFLTSETSPTWCAWHPDASGFLVSEAPSAWLQSLQVVQLAICAPAVSYYAPNDTSGVTVVATSSTTAGDRMIVQDVDVQRASFDPLTQTVHVAGPIVVYDVDVAYMRLAVWSATMDQTYLLETTPKRVNRLVNAGAIAPTLTVATLIGDVGGGGSSSLWPIVLIPNLPIWVEFTFVFPGNKTCFSGPVEQLLSALVATPAGACVVPSPTDGAGIRFGAPAQSPTSLIVRITLNGDYATLPPEPIQFAFQMAGSSSRIPFTLPSSSVWAFPHVRSTTIRPGVVAVGETVGFETQFDVPYGRPCPPSESWLAVDVLVAPLAALGFVAHSALQDQSIVDASGALSAFWRAHGIGASSLTSGTWSRDASTGTTTATLRYTYNVQEDVAHGGLMQMRLVGTRYLSPIFTWTSSGSVMLPNLDAVASPLTSSTIYTFPVSLAIESTSTVETTVGVFRALHTVDLTYVRCVGGDGLTLGAGVSRMWATFRSSSTSPSAVDDMVVDCSGGVVAPPSHVVDASGGSSAYVRFSRVVMASGYDSVQFSIEVRAPSTMVYRTISTPIQYVAPAPTAIRVASTVSSVHPGYVLVEGYTTVVSFTFDYGVTTDPRNAFTPLVMRPTDYFRSVSLVDGGSGQPLTGAVVTDGSGHASLVSSAYFDATGYTVHVPICLSSLQRPMDVRCAFEMYDRSAVLYSDLVSYDQIYRFPDQPRLAQVSFPSLSTSALLDASGCVMVTVGPTVRCALALVGGSGVLPAGGSHEVRFSDGSAMTVRNVASAVDTNQVVTDFALNEASTTVFATLTLSFAGYTRTYAPFPFCTPYTFPTSLVSSVQFTGANAIAPEDGAITTLALGAVYGVDTSGSTRAVCGVGNRSHVRLTLSGGDVASVGKPTFVSAVQVVDASGVGYGTVGAFDYTSPTVTVRSYALPTDRMPVGAGVVWFRVTLTAPDATTKSVVLASTGLAVRSVPNVAVPLPIGGTSYVLVGGGKTVNVPIRLANALAPSLGLDASLYTSGFSVKAAVVSTDISPAFGQAIDASGLTLSTTGNAVNECTATARITCASGTTTRITLVLAPTRTRVAFTVDASGGIYTFPTACSATVARNGSIIVTVGQVATCTVACIGGSALVPTGATHGLFVPSVEATLWSVVAGGDVSPLPSSNGRLDYKVIPWVVPPGGVGTTALWTLGFAGLTSTYALSNVLTASAVYAVPTSLSASVQFVGTSGIKPDDGSITTLALGAAYGVDTSGSASSICGTGNTSHITMTLVGGDVGSIVKPTAVSAVQVVDASGVSYGTVGRFDYTSPLSTVVVVRSYTVATTLPASGTVSFKVETRSPDGLTTTLTSSAMTVVVDATTVSLGTFATGLTLLSGESVLVPVTFGPVTPVSAEVSSSGTFSSLATSVASGSFAATYSGAVAAMTFTFVVAPTRRRLTANVAATGILVWPASATTAPVSASNTVTIGVASAMTTTLSASVPTGAVTATLSALTAADSSSGATLGVPSVSGSVISYTFTATSNTTYTATVTLHAGTYAKAYAQTIASEAQVYTWPTVSAVLALSGATSGSDYNVLGFAAGRAYGSATSTASTVTLTLGGLDANTPNATAVASTGAVALYVGGTLVSGGIASYTYTSATNTIAVTSMTVGTTTGSLEFRVTVTAPSGATRVIATSGHTVYAVPSTVNVATIAGGDTYALVVSYATATQFTFSHTVSAIDSALGAFASGATTSALLTLATVPVLTATLGATLSSNKVLGATVTTTSATSTTFTFTFAATRTTASVTVATSAIYTFPASATCAVVSGGPLGGSTVTLGQTCALTYTFASALPIGATHTVSATGATASLTTASPFTTRASSAVYSLVPTAKQAIVATVTVTFGGVTVPYALTALASTAVYTMPTGLTATASFVGSNAIRPADASLTTLAVGASYGTAAGSVVCGAGNTSSIVLALTGFDATTTNATEIRTGAVSCVDAVATGTTYGTTPTYTYTAASHSASVGVYTLGATAPPSGSVRFAVVVTAPDGVPTTLRSAPFAVAVDATSATLGVVASGVTLISGSAVSVPVAFVGATPSGAEITATGGSFSAIASSVTSGAFSATYSGSATDTTLTFVVSPTRRRIAVVVPAASILVWPSIVSTTPSAIGTMTVGTASARVTTLSSALPASVSAALTALTASDASTGAVVGVPSVSGSTVSYTLSPTSSTGYTATLTLSVGTSQVFTNAYSQYTVATAAQIYAWPTVSAVLALNGAVSGSDYNVLGFAAGRAYGSATPTGSTVTLTLGNIDVDTPNTTAVAATGAVDLSVGGALVAGAVASYTYNSSTQTVAVTSMTLGTTTGALEFRVTVTAPSGATKVITTSGHTAFAVPDTVTIATIAGGDTYALVASYAIATQFTFSHSVTAINAALGAFSSGATTSALVTLATTPTITATLGATLSASRVLGATVTATTAATTFTFTFVSTRTTASVTVATSAIYSFPSSATSAVASGGPLGGSTVTLNQSSTLTYTFASALPIGATHAISATGATATLTTPSPLTSRASLAVYSLVPTAKQAIVATVTVTFGGVAVAYALTALASTAVYTMPTGLTATVSFSGSNAVSAADASLATLAVGASYGTAAGSVVCGAGNTSSIVLTLTGFDATTTNTTEIRTGAVTCVDSVATGTAYGTTPTYTYTAASHSASVGVYTLGSSVPASGSVRFAVVVTAPDGVTTTVRSAPIATAVDATSATLGVVASGVTLISGSAVSVPVTFVGATPSGAEITATGGTFSAIASSVTSGAFSATYSGAASATTFTFVVSPTRRRIAVTVPSTSILVWPSSATTAPVSTITVGTASAMVTTLSSAVPAVVGVTVTGVTAGASVGTPSVSGTAVTYTLTTTANATCTATVTLAVAGYSQSYPQTLATADQVYAFPTGVQAVLTVSGATTTNFAAGQTYTSAVVLSLLNVDPSPNHTNEVAATGAVRVWVGGAVVAGVVASYTYRPATHDVLINTMTLGTQTGALQFGVTVTAPSNAATLEVLSSGHSVVAVPNTVTIAPISSGYSLVASMAMRTQFTFSHTNSTIHAALGNFSSGASTSIVTVASTPTIPVVLDATFAATRVIGATITATTAQQTLTFTFVATRTVVSCVVAAAAIYTFPTSCSTTVVARGYSADPLASSLIVAFSGDSLSDVSHLINTATSAKTLTTKSGSVVSAASSKFYGYSLNTFANGSPGAVRFGDFSSNIMAAGASLTVEFWFSTYNTARGYTPLFTTRPFVGGALMLGVVWSGKQPSAYSPGALNLKTHGTAGVTGSYIVTSNAWHHVALTKGGTTYNVYLNGTLAITTTIATEIPGGTQFILGGFRAPAFGDDTNWDDWDDAQAYFNDLRVYTTVKYTANFTVGTTPMITTSSIVDVGQVASCTVAFAGGSGVVPTGATHGLVVPPGETTLWSVVAGGDASPLLLQSGQIHYKISPLAFPTVGTSGSVTLGFAGLNKTYALSNVLAPSTVTYPLPSSITQTTLLSAAMAVGTAVTAQTLTLSGSNTANLAVEHIAVYLNTSSAIVSNCTVTGYAAGTGVVTFNATPTVSGMNVLYVRVTAPIAGSTQTTTLAFLDATTWQGITVRYIRLAFTEEVWWSKMGLYTSSANAAADVSNVIYAARTSGAIMTSGAVHINGTAASIFGQTTWGSTYDYIWLKNASSFVTLDLGAGNATSEGSGLFFRIGEVGTGQKSTYYARIKFYVSADNVTFVERKLSWTTDRVNTADVDQWHGTPVLRDHAYLNMNPTSFIVVDPTTVRNGFFVGQGFFVDAVGSTSTGEATSIETALLLDASDAASYPGNGTTWFDLSGKGNHATLIAGATYSAGFKAMYFDGAIGRCAKGTFASSNPFNGAHSLFVWCYQTQMQNYATVVANDGGTSGVDFQLQNQAGGADEDSSFGNTWRGHTTHSATKVGLLNGATSHMNRWICISICNANYTLGSHVTSYGYNNGALFSDSGHITLGDYARTSGYVIGKAYSQNDGAFLFIGYVGYVAVYPSQLSLEQFVSRFNATRSKFGVSSDIVLPSFTQIYNTADDNTKTGGYNSDSSSASLVLAFPGDSTSEVSASINASSVTKTVSVKFSGTVVNTNAKYYGGSFQCQVAPNTGGGSIEFGGLPSNMFNGTFTVEMWIRPTAIQGGANCLLQIGAWGTAGQLWVQLPSVTGGVELETNIRGANPLTVKGNAYNVGNPKYALNTWHHFALVRDATHFRFYVNGITDVVRRATTLPNVSNIWIGGLDNQAVNDFYGQVQDLRIYTSVKYSGPFVPHVVKRAYTMPTSFTFSPTTCVENAATTITITATGASATSAPLTVYYGATAGITSLSSLTQAGTGTLASGSSTVSAAFPVGTWYVYVRVTSPSGATGPVLGATTTLTSRAYTHATSIVSFTPTTVVEIATLAVTLGGYDTGASGTAAVYYAATNNSASPTLVGTVAPVAGVATVSNAIPNGTYYVYARTISPSSVQGPLLVSTTQVTSRAYVFPTSVAITSTGSLTFSPADGLATASVEVYYDASGASNTPTKCGAGTVGATGQATVACAFPTGVPIYVYALVKSPAGVVGSWLRTAAPGVAPATATITSNSAALATRTLNGATYTCIRTSGTLTIPTALTTAELFMIAGGGGGSFVTGAGGGAGGAAYVSSATIPAGTYAVTVGAGGAGATSDGDDGANGGNTVAFGVTVYGGGGGAHGVSRNAIGRLGGCGGGGGWGTSTGGGVTAATGSITGITGTLRTYGNAGGSNATGLGSPSYPSSGGGGIGWVGGTATSAPTGGAGGAGLSLWSDWCAACGVGTGDASGLFWIGGGGGGSCNEVSSTRRAGEGGQGGGGRGGFSIVTTVLGTDGIATSGLDYSGGGGGAGNITLPASGYVAPAGRGGSGVIIIKQQGAGVFTTIARPTDVAGLQVWLDGSDPTNGAVPADNATIATWVDKSGNARGAVPVVGANRAVFKRAGSVGGIKPTLGTMYFNNTPYRIPYTGFAPTYTIVSIFRVERGLTSAGLSMTPVVSNNSCYVLTGTQDCQLYFGMWQDMFATAVGVPPGTWHGLASNAPTTSIRGQWVIATMQYSAATRTTTTFLNGIAMTAKGPDATAQNNGAAWNDLYIGQAHSAGADYRLQGYIGEILIYNSVISATDRQSVESYLSIKYGLGIACNTALSSTITDCSLPSSITHTTLTSAALAVGTMLTAQTLTLNGANTANLSASNIAVYLNTSSTPVSNCTVTGYVAATGVVTFSVTPTVSGMNVLYARVSAPLAASIQTTLAHVGATGQGFFVDADISQMVLIQEFANAQTSPWVDFTSNFNSAICINYPASVKLKYNWQGDTGTSIPAWRTHWSATGTLNALVDGNSPMNSNVSSSPHLWGNVNASRYLYGTPLWRLLWYFPQKRTMKSLVLMMRVVWRSPFVKFEIVASNDNVNFVRLPTKWTVNGTQVYEDTFSLEKARVDWNGRDLWRVAVDGTSINAHKTDGITISSTSRFWLNQTSPCVMAEILVENHAQYLYYGLGLVGSDCPYSEYTRSATNVRTYARTPCGSAYLADNMQNLSTTSSYPSREDLQWPWCMSDYYTESSGIVGMWEWMRGINNTGFSWNIAVPQVVTSFGAEPTTYKIWRLRATSAFLGTCGATTRSYFWKMGLYRNTAVAMDDTYGLSSNNYLQQYANVLGISTAGGAPATQSGTARDALFVSKGDWSQAWGSATTFAGVNGTNALQTNAVAVTFGAEFACLQCTLDVAGTIGAIRFPANMYCDANVRGGTFILEASNDGATWTTMVATTSGTATLGRDGIMAPSVATAAAGNVALTNTLFSIAPAAMQYKWPTVVGTPVVAGGGSLQHNVATSCTIALSGNGWTPGTNVIGDFNVHLVASNTAAPYWTPGATTFNCTVTQYNASTGVLAFTVAPAIVGNVAFAVFVRSGEGTGVLGTPMLSSPLTIVDSSMFYVYPTTDVLNFNGTSDFINLGNLGTVGSAYTIELFFKSQIVGTNRNVCDMNYSTYASLGNSGPRLEQGWCYWLWGGSTVSDMVYATSTDRTISADVWYYIAMTMNNGTVNVYMNAAQVATNVASSASGYLTTFGSVNLGRGSQPQGTARYFSGSIAGFKIYKRVLTFAETTQNFNNSRSRFGI